MTEPVFKIGDAAIAELWIGGGELVTVVEGPLQKSGKLVYKVRHVECEMLYDEDHLTPCVTEEFGKL